MYLTKILALAAITFLLGCQPQPDEATRQLQEVLKKDKQIECDYLRKEKSPQYDKNCTVK